MNHWKARVLNDENSPVAPPLIWFNVEAPNVFVLMHTLEERYWTAWRNERRERRARHWGYYAP